MRNVLEGLGHRERGWLTGWKVMLVKWAWVNGIWVKGIMGKKPLGFMGLKGNWV